MILRTATLSIVWTVRALWQHVIFQTSEKICCRWFTLLAEPRRRSWIVMQSEQCEYIKLTKIPSRLPLFISTDVLWSFFTRKIHMKIAMTTTAITKQRVAKTIIKMNEIVLVNGDESKRNKKKKKLLWLCGVKRFTKSTGSGPSCRHRYGNRREASFRVRRARRSWWCHRCYCTDCWIRRCARCGVWATRSCEVRLRKHQWVAIVGIKYSRSLRKWCATRHDCAFGETTSTSWRTRRLRPPGCGWDGFKQKMVRLQNSCDHPRGRQYRNWHWQTNLVALHQIACCDAKIDCQNSVGTVEFHQQTGWCEAICKQSLSANSEKNAQKL